MDIKLEFQHIRNRIISRLSLQHKILILFVGASIIILLFTVFYIGTKAKKNSIDAAQAHIAVTADKHAEFVKSLLEKELFITRTLSSSISSSNKLTKEKIFDVYTNTYRNVLSNNPDIIAVWDSWEMKYLDSTYQKDYGRYKTTAWRENGNIKSKTEQASINGDPPQYLKIKKENSESIEEPYFDTYDNNQNNKILMTSIIVPNIINQKFAGVVGVDIPLTNYYEIFKQIKPFEDSYAFLLSNTLKYVAYPDKDFIGESALNEYEEVFLRNGAIDRMSNGNPVFFEDFDINGVMSYFTIRPISVGDCKQHWAMVVVVPKATIVNESILMFWKTIIIGFLGVILLAFFIFYSSKRYVINPISVVTNTLERLSKGHVSNDMIYANTNTDEIGVMVNHLNKTIEGLTEKTKFAEEIGSGNYSAQLNLLSDEDVL